jgi:hypothetical protein
MGRVSHFRRLRRFRLLPAALRPVISAALLAIGCLQAATPARALELLTDDQMDEVTAGRVTMDVELSANANGPSVITSTQGSVTVGQTTGLRIAVDDTAPPEARARLLGSANLEVGIAAGKADASGARDATCAADVGVSGADVTYIKQSHDFTAVTATCSCTALAVGILAH